MEVLLATFQGLSAISDASHAHQVKLFEQLNVLARTLETLPAQELQANVMHIEKALKDLVFSEFATQANVMTWPFFQLVRHCFSCLYRHNDSRDMLLVAGEFLDAMVKTKLAPSTQAACLASLGGIFSVRGKALLGHLPEALMVVDSLLNSSSKQTLMKIASLAVSNVSQVASTSTSPNVRAVGVYMVVDAVVGTGSSSKVHWGTIMRLFSRAVGIKSSVLVREAGLKGLLAMAEVATTDPLEKFSSCLIPLLGDEVLSVRLLAGEVLGAYLSLHRSTSNWEALSSEQLLPSKKVQSLESLSWKSNLSDVCDALVNAFHASSTSLSTKQALAKCITSMLKRMPRADAASELSAQIDFLLRLSAQVKCPDTSENVLCCSYTLREALSMAPERLQLHAAKHFIDIASHPSKHHPATIRACLVELQNLIALLGEGFESLKEECVTACYQSSLHSLQVKSAVLHETNAVLRATMISVPSVASSLSNSWLEELVMAQNTVETVKRPVLALCSIVRAASAMNLQGAIPTVHLFAMGKALASKHLDMDSDSTGRFGAAGWELIDALLSLGPTFFSPYLTQLFALWQETFHSSKNEFVLTAAINALGSFLRNVNEGDGSDDKFLLKKASASLMNIITVSFASNKSNRFRACYLLCLAKCTEVEQDLKLPAFAMHHIILADFRSSFLKQGGLLNPHDDILEFESILDRHDGLPIEDTMENTLLQPNPVSSSQEAKDCYDACAELHSLLGQRARNRPKMTQRLKAAGMGNATSESRLPRADARSLPPTHAWNERIVDSSITYFASCFLEEQSDDARFNLVNELLTRYLNQLPPNHPSPPPGVNGQPEFRPSLTRTYNVCACMLACVSLLEDPQNQPDRNVPTPEWQKVIRDFIVNFLGSSLGSIRRAAAEAVSIFVRKIATFEMAQSICEYLETMLKSPTEKDMDMYTKCGCLLAAVKIRQELFQSTIEHGPSSKTLSESKSNEYFYIKESSIYDCCKMTRQPLRVWSLHCWNIYITRSDVETPRVFFNPTLALINAHLLTEAGNPEHESQKAQHATMCCLGTLLNGIIMDLGPDLALDDERADKVFSLWFMFKSMHGASPSMQKLCIRFCELFALFHPSFLQARLDFVKSFLLDIPMRQDCDIGSVYTPLVTCLLRFHERQMLDSSDRLVIFRLLEKQGRKNTNTFFLPMSPTLGSYQLRKTWACMDMAGATSMKLVNRRNMQLFPPEHEEQACYVISHIIQTGGGESLGK